MKHFSEKIDIKDKINHKKKENNKKGILKKNDKNSI